MSTRGLFLVIGGALLIGSLGVVMVAGGVSVQPPEPKHPWQSSSAASAELDRLGTAIRQQEERAYDVAAGHFFQDPEDAEESRPGFYLSSVKILRLAVGADSSNALALYHLGLALARKSYAGFGSWNQSELREAVSILTLAEVRAVGRYARWRAQIARDLVRERRNLDRPGPGGDR